MDKSQVTVFIPTFNRLAWLKKAVASVLSQGDFVRLHVLDNASSDGTATWLNELAAADQRVQVTLRNQNVGGLQNFMDGFDSVKTPYLVPLADDDELFPGFLGAALSIAVGRTSLGAVVFQTVGESDGQVILISPETQGSGLLDVRAHLLSWARSGHYLSWSSVLWSTEAIRESHAAKELLLYGLPSDVWFQFRVFSAHPVYLVPEPGSRFNFHANQAWRRIGPSTMCEFGRIVTNIRRNLKRHGSFQDKEVHEIAANLSRHFCLLMEKVTASTRDADHFKDLLIGSACFVRHMYPVVGLRHFPFKAQLLRSMPPRKRRL